MIKIKQLSVAIVTKNRATMLSHCIASLLFQPFLPWQLIIVDNASTDETKKVVRNLQKNSKIDIKYNYCNKLGYPQVYNCALQLCKTKWLVFIDDDCVASENWLLNIKQNINQLRQNDDVAILGRTDTFYSTNIYCLVTSFLEQLWKANRTIGSKIIDYEILDNKNIVYNLFFLKKHRLRFDENLARKYGGANEDCDLGMQIYFHGGRAYYNSKILVFHKDADHFLYFYKRLLKSIAAHRLYEQKWQIQRKKIKLKKKQGFNFLLKFIHNKKITLFQLPFFLLHLSIAYLLIKVFSLEKKCDKN